MRTSRPGRDYAACAPSPAMPAASTAEGKPVRLKLRRVTSFCAASIAGFAKRSLDPDCARQRRPSVFHQRHRCRVHAPGCHDRVGTEGGTHAGVQMGQHRAGQHQGRHHRNRRYDLAAMIPRLTWAAVRTAPMPYRLLKLAEVYA